jgi:hypothetical protein
VEIRYVLTIRDPLKDLSAEHQWRSWNRCERIVKRLYHFKENHIIVAVNCNNVVHHDSWKTSSACQRMKNITHILTYVSSTVAYDGIRRGPARQKIFLSMLKIFVRIRTYSLYDKLALGARWIG